MRPFVSSLTMLCVAASVVGCGSSSTTTRPENSPLTPADTTVGLPLPGVIPAHGIGYTTAAGVVIAEADGTVLFTIPGMVLVDTTRDSSTSVGVVQEGVAASPDLEEYSLAVGAATMTQATAAPSGSPYSSSWTGEGAPDGCVRDARRPESSLLLCAAAGSDAPRAVATWAGGESVPTEVATSPDRSGNWVDAIEGPDGSIAATWSGECEILSAFRIDRDGAMTDVSAGKFAVAMGWRGDAVLVARYGGCSNDGPEDGLFLVQPDGSETRVPTPDANGMTIVW